MGGGGLLKPRMWGGVGQDSRKVKQHPRIAINYVNLNYKLQVEKTILLSTPNKHFNFFSLLGSLGRGTFVVL